MLPTPHISLKDKNKMSRTVLMPGDPLRAKYIADNFLTNAELVNDIRNMLGYTGYYNDKQVSVMGSGMGMPSIGIYSYELFNFYDVELIIRVGSAGSYTKRLDVNDVVLAAEAWSESTFAKTQDKLSTKNTNLPNLATNEKLKKSAKDLGIILYEEKIHSSDVFYTKNPEEYKEIYMNHGCSCVEMEAFALFHNASICGKKAACLLTISNSLITGSSLSAEQRESSFNDMIKIALGAL